MSAPHGEGYEINPELSYGHLFDRICWAQENLRPVQTDFRVIYEDPAEPGMPAKVLIPAPEWMAMALHGDLLPPIDAYLRDREITDAWESAHGGTQDGFDWRDHGAAHPYAKPRGPMSEQEAIEYLIQKDIPPRVWRDYRGNRTIMRIVKVSQLPATREWRNAWAVAQDQPGSQEIAA
jgi:hypothetical protein